MDKKTLERAFLIRRAEEALLKLFAQGELSGTVHTCVGQELSAVAVAAALNKGDTVFSTHRGHGHYLAFTGDVEGLLAEIMAREGACVGGRGGSQHLQKDGFHASGIQGGLIPVAAGAAWRHLLSGGENISVAFFGDGTLGQGVLYETLNIAAKWKLPVLFVLEDNGIAQSTLKTDVFAADIARLVSAYGIRYFKTDTWEWDSLRTNCQAAAALVRSGSGPAFLHVETDRLNPHSKGDDLRPASEVERCKERDLLGRLLRAKDRVAEQAFKKAEETIAGLVQELRSRPPAAGAPTRRARPLRHWRRVEGPPAGFRTYGIALNRAYHELAERRPEVLFLGEDIQDPYGGCFRITAGLSEKFPARVKNTPISEAAITGLATGAALEGNIVFVEWMFGDFSLLAADQVINQAAKLKGLCPEREVNVFFRTPMGGGRGYGPTHSQSLEKHFLGVPDLEVFYFSNVLPPAEALAFLSGSNFGPTLLCENKNLYAQPCRFSAEATGAAMYRDATTLDTLLEWGERPDILLMTYGACSDAAIGACRKLYETLGRPVSLLVFARLSGYSVLKDMDALKRFRTFLSFEEGFGYAGFFSEVAAQMSEQGLCLKRRMPPMRMIPAAAHMEREHYFSVDEIIAEVLEAQDDR